MVKFIEYGLWLRKQRLASNSPLTLHDNDCYGIVRHPFFWHKPLTRFWFGSNSNQTDYFPYLFVCLRETGPIVLPETKLSSFAVAADTLICSKD